MFGTYQRRCVPFFLPRCETDGLRGPCFFVVRFYRHSLFSTTSGDPIFRCTTKDRGERRVKGLRPPLDPRGNVLGHSDVLCAYLLAMVRVTRLSRLRRCRLSPCLCVLRCSEKQQDLCNHPTSDQILRRLFLKCQRFRRTTCSTIESVEAVRSTPRAGLNRVNCITANS